MPGFARVDRQAEELKRGLDSILRNQVKDPRIPDVFSITNVELTRDLKYAKVFISAMVQSEQEKKDMLKALRSASGFIRHALGQEVILRAIPELTFVFDDSIAYSVHISSLLREISTDEANGEEEKP
ncbi:MAG: 30S ribosome-binding factor RbfA [Candidatus Spyradocola sp.]|jgi:ribosome-binding factor A